MPCAKVDHLQTVHFLCVGNNRESIVSPDFVFCLVFCLLDVQLKLGTITLFELTTKRTVGDFTRHAPPSESQLHLVTKIAARLFETPYERPRVETRRLSPLSG